MIPSHSSHNESDRILIVTDSSLSMSNLSTIHLNTEHSNFQSIESSHGVNMTEQTTRKKIDNEVSNCIESTVNVMNNTMHTISMNQKQSCPDVKKQVGLPGVLPLLQQTESRAQKGASEQAALLVGVVDHAVVVPSTAGTVALACAHWLHVLHVYANGKEVKWVHRKIFDRIDQLPDIVGDFLIGNRESKDNTIIEGSATDQNATDQHAIDQNAMEIEGKENIAGVQQQRVQFSGALRMRTEKELRVKMETVKKHAQKQAEQITKVNFDLGSLEMYYAEHVDASHLGDLVIFLPKDTQSKEINDKNLALRISFEVRSADALPFLFPSKLGNRACFAGVFSHHDAGSIFPCFANSIAPISIKILCAPQYSVVASGTLVESVFDQQLKCTITTFKDSLLRHGSVSFVVGLLSEFPFKNYSVACAPYPNSSSLSSANALSSVIAFSTSEVPILLQLYEKILGPLVHPLRIVFLDIPISDVDLDVDQHVFGSVVVLRFAILALLF